MMLSYRYLRKFAFSLHVPGFKRTFHSGGLSNRLYICEDTTNSSTCPECPSKLLIRLYGGKVCTPEEPYRTLNESGECLLFGKFGELGLGPKLFGIFEGGRLEQFIPSHTLNVDDIGNDRLRKEVSLKLARMHNVQAPFELETIKQIEHVQIKFDNIRHKERFLAIDLKEFGCEGLGM